MQRWTLPLLVSLLGLPSASSRAQGPEPSRSHAPSGPEVGSAEVRPGAPTAPLPDLTLPPDAAGPVGRSELIRMALRTSPQLWRFKSEVAFYAEAEKAAYDWRDPEFRLGWDREFEADLERPYTERRLVSEQQAAFESRSASGRRTETDPAIPPPGISGTFEESRQVVSRTGQQQEIVRRVTPGKYRDVIETTVYEVETTRSRETRNERNFDESRGREDSQEVRRRRVVSKSREIREHPNSLYPDEAYTVQMIFFIPNPWQMKAQAARMRGERNLSEARMRAEIRQITSSVNERYDELQYWHLWNMQDEKLLQLMERNVTETEKLAEQFQGLQQLPGVPSFFDPAEVPRARIEVIKAQEEVFDSVRRGGEVRLELAQLAGLQDPGRITLRNQVVLKRVDLSGVDLATLVELAKANRPEFHELQARQDIARAELREVRARRLPWFEDVRLGYSRNIMDGYRDQDEFRAMLTFRLPLISSWQNKDHRMHEAVIQEMNQAKLGMAYGIEAQVAHAVSAVREAGKYLDLHDAARRRALADLQKLHEAAEAAGDKAPRVRLDIEEERIKLDRSRLQWVLAYAQAVNALEVALGMSLQEAFSLSITGPMPPK